MATNSKEKRLFQKTKYAQKNSKASKKSINFFEKIKRFFRNPLALTITVVSIVLITTIIVFLVQHIDGQNNGQQSNSSSSQSSNNENNKVSSTEQSNQDGSEDTHSDENNGQQSNSSSSQSSNNDQKPDNNTEDANGNAVSNNANNQPESTNNDTPSNDTCERRTAHYPCVPEFYETAPALVFNQSFYDEMHSKTTDDMNNYFLAHYRELLEPALSFNRRLENVIYNADYKNKIQYYIDNYQEEADGYMRNLLSTYYGAGNSQTINYIHHMSYTERKKAQFDKFLYWDWSTKRRHVTCDKMISYLRDYESTVGGSWDCSEHFTDLIITPAH